MSSPNPEGEEPPCKKTKLDENEDLSKGEDEEDVILVESESQKDDEDDLNDPKYDNIVTAEELEKLREFTVLDEVKSNDEDSNDEESESSDDKSEDLPEEEIERMLDKDLPEVFKAVPQPKAKPYVTRQKIVLEEKGVNHWEALPLDWMMVRHYSGMLVYMHRTTRVCTLSKPYFLGKGNTRRHDIPISAIPCLAYRKALEEEKKQQEIDRKIEEQIKNGTWCRNLAQAEQISNAINNSNQGKVDNKNNNINNDVEKNHWKSNVKKSNDEKKCPFSGKTSASKICNVNKSDEAANAKRNGVYDTGVDTGTKSDKEKTSEEQLSINIEDQGQASGNGVIVVDDSDENVLNVPNDKTDVNDCVSDTGEKPSDDNSSEKVSDVEIPKYRQPVVLPGGIVVPAPKVENINTSWKTQHLSHEQVNEYCRKLFKFKTVNIMHFNRWADRRRYTKARKTLQYPTLPDGTKLITIPAATNGHDNGGKPVKRDWVMNMDGRSYLSVFHEYVRRALQKQPVYEFVQLENAATPYQATVYIGSMQYGVGHGSSKRQAKSAAARASIHILIPEMKDDLDHPPNKTPDFSFFDQVGIEDPRISEFCAATCEPSPHAILRTCLLRNFGDSDRHIQTEMKKLEFQKIELTMKVGKHSVTVVCKNKKTAKQRASQAILQALHPHVRSWGSLLRLYGSRSVKSCKEKKLEEQQITLLQDKARHNQPNYAVLDKLRDEMTKLKDRDSALVPIGTLLLEDDLPTHSGSNLNNVDL